MKLKFLRECRDRYTGANYHIGDELVFPTERAKEILSRPGYAVEVEETKIKEIILEEDPEKVIDFDGMKVPALKRFAAEKEIDLKGAKKKEEIVYVLKEWDKYFNAF